MIHKLYSLRDRKVGVYGFPYSMPARSDEDVVEMYRREIVKESSKLFMLRDCEVYVLGQFDDVSGEFVISAKPVFVADLGQLFPEVKKDVEGNENRKV